MRAVLVTGGAGYVGSHACKALASAGYLPVTFDNLAHGHRSSVLWGPFVHGDLMDPVAVHAVLTRHRPVAVLHFAAFAYVGESVAAPAKYYRNNVAGSLNLLEAMLEHDVRRLVFSSSCATYGIPETDSISEDHPQRPINPYGWSKLMVEQLLRDYEAAYGLRWVALRYFNAAGADPDGEIGERHDPETHLIPLALQAAAGHGDVLTVHGDAHPTADGTCVRDYVHVSDLAQAHALALQHVLGGGPSSAFNLGNGRGFSVREVVEAVARVTGRPVPYVVGDPRAGDPPRLVADAARAKQVLGWTPSWPDLEEIVDSAWRWHRRDAGARC